MPALPIALALRRPTWTLVDSVVRRGEFLRAAVTSLGLSDLVEVVVERAEKIGRDPRYRSTFDVVTARGFGPPAVTAECAAALLHEGGLLLVTEPPRGEATAVRWPGEPLEGLGLRPLRAVTEPFAFQVLQQHAPCPDRYPRRVGIPGKRPLW